MISGMSEPKTAHLSRLWDEFRGMPFPRDFHLREPEGICMVSLDTYLAGCISVALDGPLDDWRREVLLRLTASLGKVLPSLGDDAYGLEYFTHLHEMALLAAELDAARGE